MLATESLLKVNTHSRYSKLFQMIVINVILFLFLGHFWSTFGLTETVIMICYIYLFSDFYTFPAVQFMLSFPVFEINVMRCRWIKNQKFVKTKIL